MAMMLRWGIFAASQAAMLSSVGRTRGRAARAGWPQTAPAPWPRWPIEGCPLCGQRLGRLLCALKDETVFRQRTGRAQQAEVSYPGLLCRCFDVFGRLHCVGVGGVDAEGGIPQERGHLIGQEPPAPDGDAGVLPCSSCPSGVATLTVTSMPSAASWRESSRPSVVPLKTTTFIGGTPAA